ncbi:type I restriction endonuclease subunit M [Nitrosovibrio sp. Nv6]|uniref:type I restriction endonuclease subunit M n=1 Tax=Nitrosovibrio sp. Nv6 TaxID=1855340 RepID=UPI0008CFEC9C|nr:type I restriction endonuclease subunit M [Nitrosovibrio sp. Nv6]SEP42855.1 hypothetical protein SAMN05216316_3054 [Nitrosovibrio sp. Nv6]
MYYTPAYAAPTSNEEIVFPLGRFVATPGAIAEVSLPQMLHCLRRHMQGDWGCVCAEDVEVNNAAVRAGERILSAYPIDENKPSKGYGENTFWIITEADRSVTTFLLPDEY